LGEGNVKYHLAKQCNNDVEAIELLNDELSEKMIVLEQENESLKNFLKSVTDDIMDLEARIRALETKSTDKGTFSSAVYTNASQIPTRH
jgi:predicted  nucleic acid-binding Zn-ribbon protein